jgi:hypothetical protein
MKTILTTISAIILASSLAGQGCSDAGFCSIGNLSHQTHSQGKAQYKNYLKLQLPAGLGDDDVFVFAPSLEYGLQSKSWLFAAKLTGNIASGNLGDASGAGDLFLSATYSLPAKGKWMGSITLGTKIPLNNGDLEAKGLPLPMQYQSSLGTFDAILGFALRNDRWNFAAGWQQPLTETNGNGFLPELWANDVADIYPPSNDFKRKGDVLLRGSYRFLRQPLWSLEAGLLGIYHLGEDSYRENNQRIAIEGSKGLTLNATLAVERVINKRWSLGLTAGAPLVVRDIRPDGLTRSFVITPQINYRF